MASRGRPFEPGNRFGRGRPRGSRNKATLVAQELLDSHAEALVRKCLVMALQGDRAALRLAIERLLPVRRQLPLQLKPMRVTSAADVSGAHANLVRMVAAGEITPGEGQTMGALLEGRRRMIETEEHERRLQALEQQHAAS